MTAAIRKVESKEIKYNHAANYCMEEDKNKSIVKSTDNPFAYKVDCSTNRETGSN